MPNQTPHTPQNQTPPPADERVTFAMKPPIISPEIYERFEQLIAKPFSPEVIEACNKAQREKREREKKQQLKEYIEINGILLETENLGKPQNPKIKINQQVASETIPQAWEKNGNRYYNFPGARAEAKYLGKTIPTQKQWEKICEPFGEDGERLSKELNIPIVGYRDYDNGFNQYFIEGCYWSSTFLDNIHISSLVFDSIAINSNYGSYRGNGYSVRCIMKPKEKIQEWDHPPF